MSRAPDRPARVGWRLWWGVFGYAAVVAVFVQAIAIPRWLPEWHAGQGLLSGLDSVRYHRAATEQAEAIRTRGWAAWRYRPRDMTAGVPAGIASAVYAVTVPAPWTMIPVNAALHATAAVVLLAILRPLASSDRVALLGVLPFVAFPSAITWYTQLLRDGWAILGVFVFVRGWIGLARAPATGRVPWRATGWLLPTLLGAVLAWVARPYLAQVLLASAVMMALLLTGVVAANRLRGGIPRQALCLRLAAVWAAVALLALLAWVGGGADFGRGERAVRASGSGVSRPAPRDRVAWEPSPWLPRALDDRLRSLATVRRGYQTSYPGAGTNVDVAIGFRSAGEVVAYLPRAAQLALFAPFPSAWVEAGATPGGSLMRRVVALEMIFAYAALAILPAVLWRWRGRLEAWLVLVHCLTVMVVYATVIANVGALHRMRYGFMTLLVGTSLVGAWSWWRQDRRPERRLA